VESFVYNAEPAGWDRDRDRGGTLAIIDCHVNVKIISNSSQH
jgi:hypothetical protein